MWAETSFHSPANTALHDAYGRYFKLFAAAAALLHALLFLFLVTPRGEGFAVAGEDLEVFDLPPEVEIPPPPEEIARPATPVIAEESLEEDITIAETVILENQPVPATPPPPPRESHEVGDTYEFVPFTVRPGCQRNCAPDDILRHLPTMLRRSGVSCSLTMGIRIDASGNVTATDLLESSGNRACDQAAEGWARTTRWTPAYNRDQPVVVWIAQPLILSE